MRKYRWMKSINYNNSYIDFNKSWKKIFKFDFEKCIIKKSELDTLLVITPRGYIADGGFVHYTDTPNLLNNSDIYYTGGCTWGEDLNGVRFERINKQTNRPENKNAVDMEIIRRYIRNEVIFTRSLKINKIVNTIKNN